MTGTVRPIHLKRRARKGTVKFSGPSLSEQCAKNLERYARKRGWSRNRVVTEVLERWNRRPGARKRPDDGDDS